VDFGPDIVGLQSPPMRHAYMSAVVEYLAREGVKAPIRILEIGSWAGASAITWAKALKSFFGTGTVTCVDPWKPYIDTSINEAPKFSLMSKAAESGHILEKFLSNLEAADVRDLVEYYIGRSQDVLPQLEHRHFHVVYIDGSHMYDDVVFDIAQAKRLVDDGGVVCGDDLELQFHEVDEARNADDIKEKRDTILDPGRRVDYHPGVTRAVFEAFGRVSAWEGFWCMRYSGGWWHPIDLGSCSLRVPDHLMSLPMLIEGYAGFNLFRLRFRILAVRQELGSVDLSVGEEALAQRFAASDVVFSDSLDAVKSRIDAIEIRTLLRGLEERIAAVERSRRYSGTPSVIDEYSGFNLIDLGHRLCAARQILGPIDFSVGERELAGSFAPSDLFFCDSPDAAKCRIDIIGIRSAVDQLTEQARHLEERMLERLRALAQLRR
jgi:predicted O-methyltransferase YrrM